MIKANKIIKIITASAIAIASIVMIVFAIINLASKKPDAPETLAFQIIACIILIISSVLSTVLVVAKDPHHFDARLVVVNGLLLGTGIFVVLPEASAAADILVGYFIPCILVGVGAFFIIATIISLVNKINKRNTDILALAIGIVMLVIGILLLCFAEKATRVTWLIIGILLLVYSIFAIISAIKESKVKSIDTTTTDNNN